MPETDDDRLLKCVAAKTLAASTVRGAAGKNMLAQKRKILRVENFFIIANIWI